ncbi:MAG: hypothetical protein KDK36_15240 [Leptospiraceae bacterium]|nr:hypothetical protein [Leptospiraceae bacterium]
MLYESDYDLYRTWWKRARPTTQGYQKCYQAKTPTGDLLQIEHNFHEGLVKIQIEPSSEKGSCFTATIKKGTIIRERDVHNGTSLSLKKKIHPFRIIFSCLPDEDILDAIGGKYEIIKIPLFRKQKESSELPEVSPIKKESFWKKVIQKRKDSTSSGWRKLKERIGDDLKDAVFGFSLCTAIYFHFFDFVIVGWSLAIAGFLFGGIDWLLRKRDPLLTKVLIFFGTGSYFFYTGYTRF